MNMEGCGIFNMNDALFIVDLLKDIVDMVVYCSHSVKPFFCASGEAFVVVGKMYSACIKALVTSLLEEFVSSGGCGIVGKFCER